MKKRLRNEIALLIVAGLLIITTLGCVANSGVKDPPPNEAQGLCSEASGNCVAPSQPAVPHQENRGVTDPRTGEYLLPSGKGVYNPRTGDYYVPSGSGYYNPKTGEFIPKKP